MEKERRRKERPNAVEFAYSAHGDQEIIGL